MAKQSKPLTNFFKGMYKSPQKQAQYQKNPKAFIAQTKLSPAHKKLVLSGDQHKVAHAVLDEHLVAQTPGTCVKPMELVLCCV